jgi:hypothetical protein
MESKKEVEKVAAIISNGVGKFKLKGFDSQEISKVYLSQDKEGNDQVTIIYSRAGESIVPKLVDVNFCSIEEFLKWQEE